ncbi:hypothetical protein [Xenococcus sp. PCC 7305]|uniref:hypothetical protein n=1 Tax=Xenococcus sp. PCC 7305 TaxID=102125 RepID=UPI0002DA83B3|nr:hypothetical protein [Xenococcus sp. PCC 7305]
MENIFTKEKIGNLSAEIDRQIQELAQASPAESQKGVTEEQEQLPARQSQAIAEITNENPTTFLQTFRHVAKSDLCEEGGVLYG